MTWNTVLTLLVTAFLGTAFGARLTTSRETLNWTREQRFKAYGDLLMAIDKCYSAFHSLRATLTVLGFPIDARDNSRVKEEVDEYRKWFAEIDQCLPPAQLVASEEISPFLERMRQGVRYEQSFLVGLLMKANEVEQVHWDAICNKSDIEGVRDLLRRDLTRIESPRQKVADVISAMLGRVRRRHRW